MQQNRIRKAVALAIAASSLSAAGTSGAYASTTMYNTYNVSPVPRVTDAGTLNTDGWTRSDGSPPPPSDTAPLVPWVGTTGYNTDPSDPRPFNYVGYSAANWAAHITQAGDSLQISQADSFANYGIYADIDTAGGAWRDTQGPQGWRHNTDIGLFKSDVTTDVTLTVSAINGPIATFGITVFQGMDSGTNYSHHGAWNSSPLNFTNSDPFDTVGVEYVDGLGVNTVDNVSYMFGITSTNGFTFTAQAGQIYSIYLGGYQGIHWNQQHDGYQLNISTVPVPAAFWLMGSGLLGLLGLGRRRKG